MSTSKKSLWAFQLSLYPDSIPLTYSQVLHWAGPVTPASLHRYAAIAHALQHPNGVWYRFPNQQVTGYRYGLRPDQYASNFSAL